MYSKVQNGYPRKIADDFHGPATSKNPKPNPLPTPIDAAYFDKRDNNLYVFAADKVK